MGLTLAVEQRLARGGLIKHFDTHQKAWLANAQDAYDYTKKAFDGEQVRPDDIAKALYPAIEIDKGLRRALDENKLREKYWLDYFSSLVIDRTWDKIKK